MKESNNREDGCKALVDKLSIDPQIISIHSLMHKYQLT